MVPLSQLWLPIVLCAAFIFVASSLIHMVFKWHNSEFRALADEEAARSAMRGTAAGQYVMPYIGDMKRMKEPEIERKLIEGPIAFITVRPSGTFNMTGPLAMWFAYTLCIGLIAAYIAGSMLGSNAARAQVFCVMAIVPFLAYAGGPIQQGIWMGKPWSSVAKEVFDAAIYATITGATFAWLWPHA